MSLLGSLTRTKDVETVLHQNDEEHEGLSKTLSARDLTGFGIGIVIGTGLFVLTGVEAKNHAGPAITISFAVAGTVAMLAAFCYAELAAAVPTAGSSYTYAYTTIGEVFAWIIGWDLVLEFALGAATVARGWSGYVQETLSLPGTLFGEDAPVNVGAVLIVVVLGTVATVGIRESKWVTNLLVLVKVGITVFIIVAGLFFFRSQNLVPFIPESTTDDTAAGGLGQPLWQFVSGVEPAAFGLSGVFVAAGVVFFAYSGFEAVANLGEETKEPARDMPRGLIGTLVVCTALYLVVSLVLTAMVPYQDLSEGAPIADAFRQVGFGSAAVLVGIAAIAGLTTVILVDIVSMGRIGFALCRDGLLPASVGKVHPRFKTPYRITIGTTIAVAVTAALIPIDVLSEMVSIGTLFAFLVVAIAVVVLRRTKPRMKRPFRTPAVPWLPVASAVTCLALMASLATETWLRFVVWLTLGIVIYLGYGRRHSTLVPGNHPEDVVEQDGA